MDNFKIHQHLLEVSETHNRTLYHQIRAAGVLPLADRSSVGLFEFVAKTVVGQQLSSKAANTIWQRVMTLAEEHGGSVRAAVCADQAPIRSCGVSRSKMRAIGSLHDSLEAGELNEEELIGASQEAVRVAICKVWGLGNWTADMVSLFYLGNPDVWAETDGALVRAVSILTGGCEVASSAFAEQYAPYRSYLARHIWQGLDSGGIR